MQQPTCTQCVWNDSEYQVWKLKWVKECFTDGWKVLHGPN